MSNILKRIDGQQISQWHHFCLKILNMPVFIYYKLLFSFKKCSFCRFKILIDFLKKFRIMLCVSFICSKLYRITKKQVNDVLKQILVDCFKIIFFKRKLLNKQYFKHTKDHFAKSHKVKRHIDIAYALC